MSTSKCASGCNLGLDVAGCRKWSYKTTNSIFSLVFEKMAMAVDGILSRDQEAMVLRLRQYRVYSYI